MFTLLKRVYLCPFVKGCPKDGAVAVSFPSYRGVDGVAGCGKDVERKLGYVYIKP